MESGIEEAVRKKQLIPIDSICPTQQEKESAALEMIKLHQLVLTKNRGERLKKSIGPTEAGVNILQNHSKLFPDGVFYTTNFSPE